MEVTELRIGNWYNQEGTSVIERNFATGCLTKVTNYREKDICLGLSDLHLQISVTSNKPDLSPIPLTEEWLFKFGFKINTPNKRWYHNNFVAEVYKTDLGELTLLQNGTYLTDCDIKYVHQLQNLYFALTGEELTIK